LKFPKNKRIEDKEVLEKVRQMPCSVCNKKRPIHPHHLKTRGSGGDDTLANLVPLCPKHHVEIHQYGISKMCEEYPLFKKRLLGLL